MWYGAQAQQSQVVAVIMLILAVFRVASAAPHVPRYSSHVSFATPAHSFSHGVGDLAPVAVAQRTANGRFRIKLRPEEHRFSGLRSLYQGLPDQSTSVFKPSIGFQGYPRVKPSVPFPLYGAGFTHGNSISSHPQLSFGDDTLSHLESFGRPVLPASPYRVDSPNAESLWPEGLFVAPAIPLIPYGQHDKSDSDGYADHFENHISDPYLLEGIDAIEALDRINAHGELFHHEIPHVRALLANQKHRTENGLHANRLGSIRTTSPWYRT